MAPTAASRNHGNSSNGRKSSRASRSIQSPCREMLVTSASEVAAPGVSDLIGMLQDQLADALQIAVAELMVLGDLDRRIEPELYLSCGRLDMNMQPWLLA